MKTILLSLALTVLVQIGLVAQTPDKSTIHLTGEAEIKVSPDVVVFNLHAFAVDKLLNQSVKKLNDETTALITSLEQMGFNKQQLRIAGFAVQQEWEYTGSKSIPKGYRATQTITLRFDADKDKLAKLIEAFAAEGRKQYNTFYSAELSDKLKRETEKKLIEMAMISARENAAVIATQAGQRLLRIKQVNYHTDMGSYVPQVMMQRQAVMAYDEAKTSESAFQQINLEEITMRERITLIYETEQLK